MRLYLARPKAVIFDMDGLLIDTESLAMRFLAEAARHHEMRWSDEIGHRLIGRNATAAIALLTEEYGDEVAARGLLASCQERYDAHVAEHGIAVKPFVRELLEHLEARRIPCAVATSTGRERAIAKLAKAHLLDHFKVLACGDEVSRGKPAPDIYELAATRLGVQPRDCLALEDSNAGVRSAVSASMPVVMVPDLLEPDADIKRYGVQVAGSLKDVLAALM